MTEIDFTPAAPSTPTRRALLGGAVAVGAAMTMGRAAHAAPAADAVPGFRSGSAEVNGTRIHYRIGGSGPTVVLLHAPSAGLGLAQRT